MKKKELEKFVNLINELRVSQSMPYSSDPEFESGVDMGRDDAADKIEYLLDELAKSKPAK